MTDIDKVLAQLRANKKKADKPVNFFNAERRVKRRSRRKNTTRHLGKLKGHCPKCGIPCVEEDILKDECPHCGHPIYGAMTKHRERHCPNYHQEPWGNKEIPAVAFCHAGKVAL